MNEDSSAAQFASLLVNLLHNNLQSLSFLLTTNISSVELLLRLIKTMAA